MLSSVIVVGRRPAFWTWMVYVNSGLAPLLKDAAVKDRIGQQIPEALEGVFETVNELASKPYDGVVGTLPEWVPEPFQREFENRRSNLSGQYSIDELRKF